MYTALRSRQDFQGEHRRGRLPWDAVHTAQVVADVFTIEDSIESLEDSVSIYVYLNDIN